MSTPVPTGYQVWSDLLSPEQFTLWLNRTGQSPTEWPPEMRTGVDGLAQRTTVHNAEDMVQLMAQWMVNNPE